MEKEKGKVKRTMGLFTATMMLVGCVVGASVFIVPGALAAEIGPGAWLAYAIGAVVMLFAVFMFAQIGSLMPVSGANYRICATTVNGLWGFLYVWCYAIAMVFLIPIMALSFVSYLGTFIPGANNTWVAIIVIVVAGGINLVGIGLSSKIQNILVVGFIIVIAVFTVGGVGNANWEHFTPLMPDGLMPIMVAVVSTYFAYAGFNNVIELSGEIKNPSKNIMRMCFGGFIIVVILYIGMCVGIVALKDPYSLGVDAPAVFAAKGVFPEWFGTMVALAALAATWTTLNAVIAAMSRDVYALAKSRVLLHNWKKINKFGSPYNGVIVMVVIGCIMTIFSDEVMKYVNLSTTYLLLAAIVCAYASINIKKRLPEMYKNADFKLRGFWYYFWPLGVIITSAFFLILAMKDDPFIAILTAILIPVGLIIYYLRKKIVEKEGTSMEEIMMKAIMEESAKEE